MSWASLWRPPIQIRPVSHQAGPKINDKRGKDKWERLTISCKVLHMNCLSKYPEAQKQRHMILNGQGWPPLKKKKKHKDNRLLQCSFSFSFLLCAFVLCAWNSPIPPKFPRSIISGESDTHSSSSQWQLLGCHRKYAIWNLLSLHTLQPV